MQHHFERVLLERTSFNGCSPMLKNIGHIDCITWFGILVKMVLSLSNRDMRGYFEGVLPSKKALEWMQHSFEVVLHSKAHAVLWHYF
jgi:hypothetical protein